MLANLSAYFTTILDLFNPLWFVGAWVFWGFFVSGKMLGTASGLNAASTVVWVLAPVLAYLAIMDELAATFNIYSQNFNALGML
ncbi:MAG: hypothetical protein PHY45_00350 [Rhodocyclaceae bacterium]|nr:hypothetical protein [Rhodocyclaceae bacterium]